MRREVRWGGEPGVERASELITLSVDQQPATSVLTHLEGDSIIHFNII